MNKNNIKIISKQKYKYIYRQNNNKNIGNEMCKYRYID